MAKLESGDGTGASRTLLMLGEAGAVHIIVAVDIPILVAAIKVKAGFFVTLKPGPHEGIDAMMISLANSRRSRPNQLAGHLGLPTGCTPCR